MTQNQIKFLELKERQRSNLVNEDLGRQKQSLENRKFLTDLIFRPIDTVNQSMSAAGNVMKGVGSLSKLFI